MTKWKRGSSARQFAEKFAEKMIEQLKRGVAPWQKGWDKPEGSELPPYNPVTKNRYRGLNSFVLASEAGERGYADPRWTTYRGAKKIDAQVRKGEKGVGVEYWKFPTKEQEDKVRAAVQAGQEPEPLKIIHRTYTVFNAEQIEGMASLESELKKVNQWEACERAEALLQSSGANIEHRGGNRAFYRRSQDLIVLPKQEQFHSPEAYYSTALHELGHWTGHESRLDRAELMKGSFGSPEYAKEELRAEMTSVTVNGMLRLPHDPNSHASYVGAWIKTLEDNPNELRYAARDAGKMSDYILQFDRHEERQTEEKPRKAGHSSAVSRPQPGISQPSHQQPEQEAVPALNR